jgi:replicative DNA helicase
MNAVVRMAEAREMGIRVPPHSIDAEQSVLGGLMIAPDALDKVADRIAESDFYRKDHRLIWRAIMELSARGQPCDAVTLGDWFDSNGLGDMMGGAGYCVELANTIPSAANITAYAQIVREKSVMRQVIDQATQLVESAYAGQSNGVELLDRGITELMALQKVETRSEYTLRQAMTLAFAEAERARELGGRIPGIASGLVDLDRILGGWHDSDLIVIGARPAQGKTAVLLNFATACALPSGIVSAEQPAQQIGARVMSIKSLVPAERMRNGRFEPQDLRKLENAVGELCERTCMIYDRSSPTIADVSRMARKWKQQNGIRVLFVDYVQRIEAAQTRQSANKAEKVGEVVRGLKNLARDLEIPVIALAQVGRQADGRQPGMGDLSDSSEIEKEADQILTLFRPGTADDNADDSEAIISVEKNRHGPCGEIKTVWVPETMRFLSRFEGDLP